MKWKRLFYLIGIISILGGNLVMAETVSEPTDVFKTLRNQVFTFSAEEIGISPTTENPNVWGVLMEIGYSEGMATLVVLGDGTASLYFSNGGGIIGGGTHDSVRQRSRTVLESAEKVHRKFVMTDSFPFPEVDRVRFYLLTFTGTLTVDTDENELGEKRHELSELFYAAQDVITELRLIEAKKA